MPKPKPKDAVDLLQRDIFAIIWIIFIIIIILLTYYGKAYIHEMIAVSIMFLAFFLLEPVVKMSHNSKVAHYISGGKPVPPWKRFPIFFVAILIIFGIKHYLEAYLEEAFPAESINIVFVSFWLIALFAIYYLLFSQKSDEPKISTKKRRK